MTNKTNISKSQHYVPKFYLKNFSTENNKIHVFSKENNKKFCANISKVANESYFYKLPNIPQTSKKPGRPKLTEQQRKQAMEKLLSSRDGKSSKALSRFLQHIRSDKLKTVRFRNDNVRLLEINEDLKFALSIFFVLQDFRTKEHKEIIREFYTEHLTKAYQFMTEYSDEMKQNNDELKKLGIDPKDLKVVPKDEAIDFFHLQSLLDERKILGLSKFLSNTKWSIGINNTNTPLFTSDHPLVKYNYNNTPYGTGYSCDEIIIPLSPKYLLSMFSSIFWKDMTILNNKNYRVQELKKEDVIFYNYLQVIKSYNYIFSKTSEFDMVKDYLKGNPEAKNPSRSRIRFD